MRKMMRVMLLLTLCFVLLLSLPWQTDAASTSDLAFTLNSDGLSYSVTGCSSSATGELVIPSTYSGKPVTGIDSYTFYNCTGLTSVKIGNQVTDIGDHAFYGCSNLQSVTIPTSVTTIGWWAFDGCSSLTSVVIPQGVTSIGYCVFSGCSSLTSISIPTSVTTIADNAFSRCTSLSSITIPNSVTSIGSSAFYNCNSLTAVTIPNSVVSIGNSAFENCSKLSKVTIGSGVSSIGDKAFKNCRSLTQLTVDANNKYYSADGSGVLFNSDKTLLIQAYGEIKGSYTIPDSVKEIGQSAFNGCSYLTGITIPNGVVTIGDQAFYFSQLSSVTIPSSVTSIGNRAFANCSRLTQIRVDANNPSYSSDGWVLFDKDKTTLIQAPSCLYGSYTIPSTVTEIAAYAFDMCGYGSMSRVTIPNSVKSIGDYAFSGCFALTSVTIPESVTHLGSGVFQSCQKLTNVSIPDSVASVDSTTFSSCSKLTYNTYGNAKYLGNSENPYTVLMQATSTSIAQCEIHPDTKVIAGRAFSGCTSLSSVALPTGLVGVGSYAFYNCDGLSAVTIPVGVTTIGDYAFYDCLRLARVAIADTVTSIGYSAFRNCGSLTNINIPAGLTSISARMLSDCSKLTTVTIPDGITTIGYDAFNNCGKLTSINIPASVKTIESSAFYSCYYLSVISISDLDAWCRIQFGSKDANPCNAYSGDLWLNGAQVTEVTIPADMTYIGDYVFAGCNSLQAVTIPDAVTSIGKEAFYDCNNLKTITLTDSVADIGQSAFYGCSKLVDIYYDGTEAQWDEISIDGLNDPLRNATLHYKVIEVMDDGTLVVLEDTVMEALTVEVGQALDLNGHILTVDSLASFGQIIDSAGGGGLVAENLEITGNEWLPIQDSTDCYRFYEYEVSNLGTKTNAAGVSFGFTLDFEDASAYATLLESEDVQITVALSFGEDAKTFAFSKDLIARYVQLVSKYPSLRPYLKLNVTGLDSLAEGTVLTVTPSITAVSGKLQNIGTGMDHTV